MRVATVCLCIVSLAALVAAENFVGGYIMLSRSSKGRVVGLEDLRALASSARTIPINRLFIAFLSPTMVYVPGSNTLQYTGLNASTSGDYGFAVVKTAVAALQAAGVEVFLSIGGWNFNCFPYLYARYSVGGYGTSTPNYWKIQQYGGGNIDNCVEANQYCYVCEPPSEGTSIGDFSIFPEPQHSATWGEAVQRVAAGAQGSTPVWSYDMVPQQKWTDPKTGITVTVPGTDDYIRLNRDPYQDFVYLAKDLGVAGLDLDYEEFWHADYFKAGEEPGPWTLHQTVYKYAAIGYDIMINIQRIAPKLKLATAAGAVGAWSGNWWGGNLKGVWLNTNTMYSDLIGFMAAGANAGGINVMTYDLSNNEVFHECPDANTCTLDQQVLYYMNSYKEAQIPASVGFEVGVPAYPDPVHDPSHQLPLTLSLLDTIISTVITEGVSVNAFFWEIFKEPVADTNASPTLVAQKLCAAVLKTSRCSGVLPHITHARSNVTQA